jgi:hypothetical protein
MVEECVLQILSISGHWDMPLFLCYYFWAQQCARGVSREP